MEKTLPKVRMIPGEHHRDRVLSGEEEVRYLSAAADLAREFEGAYQAALGGIRAKRGEQPRKPDAFLLRDMTTVLLDCGLRPDECFRLEWVNVTDGAIEIKYGKTDNARRRIPLPPRSAEVLALRRSDSEESPWVFPAETRSGHAEPSSIKKQHAKACTSAGLVQFPLYTLRHTCLTRWSPHMDPWTLAHLAGHRDMAITKKYPEKKQILDAMERVREAQGGHTSGHTPRSADAA